MNDNGIVSKKIQKAIMTAGVESWNNWRRYDLNKNTPMVANQDNY